MIQERVSTDLSPAAARALCDILLKKIELKRGTEYAALGVMTQEQFFDKVVLDGMSNVEEWKSIFKPSSQALLVQLALEKILDEGHGGVYIKHELLSGDESLSQDGLQDERIIYRMARWMKVSSVFALIESMLGTAKDVARRSSRLFKGTSKDN
jgi:hypothetical protein